jgi:hypothetical protein
LNHPLQCQCGTVKGFVANPRDCNRVICYCKDCQAFAHFLRRDDVLDERGGSDVIQVLPKNVTFTAGTESLACMRLTDKGLLRWYAKCCNTPMGNTLSTPKLSFVGLVHSCLRSPQRSLDDAFGPVRAWFNANSATGEPKPKEAGMGTVMWWFFSRVLKARINGEWKRNPFFDAASGKPIVTPTVLRPRVRP